MFLENRLWIITFVHSRKDTDDDEDDEDDEYAGLPLWQKGLKKKRDEEQRLKEITKKQKVC